MADLYQELGIDGMASFQPVEPAPVFQPNYNTTESTLRSIIQDPNIPEADKGTAYQNIGPLLQSNAAAQANRDAILAARANDFAQLQNQGRDIASQFGIVSPTAAPMIPPQSQVAQVGDAVPSSPQGPMPAVPSLVAPEAPSMMPAPKMHLTNPNTPNPYMDLAKIQGQKGDFASGILNELAAKQDAVVAKEQERQKLVRDEFDKHRANMEAVQKEREAIANQNPAEYGSTWQKIGAAISMGLGAYAAAINRTPNYAAQVIDDAIKSNIAQQKIQLEKVGAKEGQLNNNLAFFRSRISDERAADAAAQASDLNKAKLQIEAFSENLRGDEAKANAKIMIQELEAKRQAAQMEALQRFAQIAKDQSEVLKNTAEAGSYSAGQPGAVGIIKSLPKDLQAEGYKELKASEDFEKTKQDVIGAYKEAMKIGPSGAFPSWLGGNKETYKSWKGKMAGAIIGKVPGIKSDKDFEEVIVPQLPGMLETGAAAQDKLKSFESWIEAQSPSTPLLTSIGYKGQSGSAGQSMQTREAPKDIVINGVLIPKGTKLQKVAGGWQPIQ